MSLPLTNLPHRGFFILPLYFIALQTTVFTVSTNIPNDISPCQELTYQITIGNSSPQAQAAGSLQYCLPEGLVYTGIDGLVPVDVSDLRCPVFDLPALPGNGSVSFQLHVRLDCSAEDKGGVRDTIRITSGGVPQDPLFGSEYNIRTPVITLQPGQNWNYTGAMDDVFTRTFVLKNEGFGAAYQLFVIDTFGKAGLELLNTTGTMQGDTLLLTGADLGANGFLGHGDSVVITQEFHMTGCPDQTLYVIFGWSCPDGQVCTLVKFDQYSVSSANTPTPVVVQTLAAPLLPPKPCEPSLLQIRIENTGTAPALNLEWMTGLSTMANDPVELWYKYNCYPLENFSVGNALLPDITAGDSLTPHHTLFSGLLSDPDGPGGLTDEDGDGQFDDLAPGNTAIITLTVGFNPSCKACNAPMDSWFVGSTVSYSGACGGAVSPILFNNPSTGISFTGNTFDDLNSFLYDAGKQYDFNYTLDADFSGLRDVCPDDSLILEVQLPVVLQVGAGFQPTLDGISLPYWTKNDSVFYVLLPETTGELTLPLTTLCPPDIDDSAVCTPPYEPRTYRLHADLRWTCGNGCGQIVELVCLNGEPFTVDCPRPDDSTQMHGVFADSFSVQRISLGFLDNAMTARVDLATPGLRLDTAIPYDTVLMRAFAVFEGTAGDVFDSTKFQLYYWNGIAEPYFHDLETSVTLTDSETGQVFTCNNVNIEYRFLAGYHIWEIELLPFLQTGGCLMAAGVHFTPGDRLGVVVKARMSEYLPIDDVDVVDDLRIRFPYVYHGDSLLCEMKNTDFRVINPDYAFQVEDVFPEAVCDDLLVRISFKQGYSPRVNTDIFPGEIRPLYTYDTLYVTLGPGYAYQPGSAVWEYQSGDGAPGPPPDAQLPLADPQVVTLPSGEEALLFIRPAGLPVTDYYKGEAPAALVLRAQTLCPPDTTKTNAMFSGHRFLATLDSTNVHLTIGAEGGPDFNELSLAAAAPVSFNRDPVWVVEICNPGYSFTLNEPLFFIENGPGLQLTSATDITDPFAPELLTFVQPDSGHAIVQGLVLPQDECRQIQLQATIAECRTDTLEVLPGFQCDGAGPCILDHPLALYFVPKNSLAQVNVTGLPGTAVDLCDPIDYEITVLNVDEGPMYDLEVLLKLPQSGQVLVPGSCSVAYNGFSAPVPDPLPGPDGLIWALDFSKQPFSFDALPGVGAAPGNAVTIRFQVETTCGYIDGSRFFYAASWSNACGGQKKTPEFVAPSLQINGAPTATNSYQIDMQMPYPASFCAENAIRISIANPGDLGPTTANEKIRVVVPAGFHYVPGSYLAGYNGPAGGPVEVPYGDVVFLYFDVLPGVAGGDSMVFTFRVRNTGSTPGCSMAHDFWVQMLQTANLTCDNAACDVDFILVEKQYTQLFEKPAFALSGLDGTGLPLDIDLENWQLEFTIDNTSVNLPGGGGLQVQILLDNNQNAQLDNADTLVKTITVDVSGLLPGAGQLVLETANISGLQGCSGLWVILSDTACSCTQDQVYIPNIPIYNAGADTVLCAGADLSLGAPAMAGYQYEWMPASPYLSGAGVPDPDYLFTGSFGAGFVFAETLVLKTTRPQGCISFDTVTIETHRVDVALMPAPVLCWGDSTGSVSALVQGAVAPVVYNWDFSVNAGDTLPGVPAGIYTLMVSDALGCTDEATAEVTQPEPLALNLAPSDYNGYGVRCAGGTDGSLAAVAGGGAGGYQFAWSSGDTGPSINMQPAGAFTVSVTDNNGCVQVDSAILTEPLPLLLDAVTVDAICPDSANGSLTVTISGGVAPFSANNQVVPANTWVQNNLPGGQYTVVVADANGCTSESSAELKSLFSTFAVVTDSVTCFGGADGYAAISGSGFPPFQFIWSNGSTDSSATGPASVYSCLVTDALGCAYPLSAPVGEPPALAGSVIPRATLCHGDSTGQISISAAGGTPPYMFSMGGQTVSPLVDALPPGVYLVDITDRNGCTLNLEAIVGEPEALSLHLTVVDARCHGSSTGQVQPMADGGILPYAYLWSNGSVAALLDAIPAGPYGLTLSDANNCTLTAETTVGEPAAYTPVFTVDRIPCAGKSNGILTVEGLPDGTFYGLDQNPVFPFSQFKNIPGGPHVLAIRDSLGCTFEFEYDMPSLPLELGRVLADTAIHLGDSAWLRIELNPGLPAVSVDFEWLNANDALSGCDTCPSRWVQPLKSTYFPVRFFTPDGCVWESRALVQVLRDSVYAPNVIFPGASLDENKYFTLYGRPGEIVNIRFLKIFDRWGEAVFERQHFPLNDYSLGWDGSFRNEKLAPGVFVWIAEIEYFDGEVVQLKGDVTLVR